MDIDYTAYIENTVLMICLAHDFTIFSTTPWSPVYKGDSMFRPWSWSSAIVNPDDGNAKHIFQVFILQTALSHSNDETNESRSLSISNYPIPYCEYLHFFVGNDFNGSFRKVVLSLAVSPWWLSAYPEEMRNFNFYTFAKCLRLPSLMVIHSSNHEAQFDNG